MHFQYFALKLKKGTVVAASQWNEMTNFGCGRGRHTLKGRHSNMPQIQWLRRFKHFLFGMKAVDLVLFQLNAAFIRAFVLLFKLGIFNLLLPKNKPDLLQNLLDLRELNFNASEGQRVPAQILYLHSIVEFENYFIQLCE
jgi:hypothetical protein